MKILFITDAQNSSGGIKQLYYNILGLKKKGWVIFLVARSGAKIFDLAKDNIDDTLIVDFKNKRRDGKSVAKFCQKHQINLIHTFHTKGHKLGVWTKYFNHNIKLYINRGVSFIPRNPFYILYPGIDGYICNSYSVGKIFSSFMVPSKKINIIYNAFMPKEILFHQGKESLQLMEGTNVCCVTSGSKWKGSDVIIRAFNYLEDFNINLYLIGIEKESLHLINFIKEKVNKRIIFLGYRKNIPFLLSKMDIFSCTPRNGDSCPNVILEAFANGLPVVSTKVGGIPELVIDGVNGFIVKKNHPKLLAEKIKILATTNESLRKEMARNNLERIKNFSLKRKIDNLIKVYYGDTVKESL